MLTMVIERKRGSVIKAISWRIFATLVTMGIVYALTREIKLAASVGAIDILLKITLYYLHERAWNKVFWGKSKTKPCPMVYGPVRFG
jgi:adenylylsulfate kinase